jgi:hypothetical protein
MEYKIKHNVWITKNNFEFIWNNLLKYITILVSQIKEKRKELNVRFYLTEDDEVTINQERESIQYSETNPRINRILIINKRKPITQISIVIIQKLEGKSEKEDEVEEAVCHGEVIGELKDVIDENMLGGDYSLKAKIEKNRRQFNERKPFKVKKLAMEEFFKTNIDCMLKNQKAVMDVEGKRELDSISRKVHRELRLELDPFEWKIIKLQNGKMKSEIVKENDIYKDWSIDDEINEATLQLVIDISQTIINELENDDFLKKIWEYCTY